MAKIVGIKFRNSAKVYYFAPKEDEYEIGSGVIVETAKGMEYGDVVIGVKEVDDKTVVQPLKPIIRKATQKDQEQLKKNEARKPEALKAAEEKIKKCNLNMKLIDCEFTFDASKVIFYFTADGRIGFRELVKELASYFKIRIELRQVGIRDEAKLLGGIAPCGRECCCGSCMPDFKKVSIKMAKTQGLSLNPTKISGLCGRLMCCLEYENDHYAEVFKKMPKLGSEVTTPDGKGMVISNNMLKLLVKVKIENPDGSLIYKDFELSDIKAKKVNRDDDADLNVNEEIKEILD